MGLVERERVMAGPTLPDELDRAAGQGRAQRRERPGSVNDLADVLAADVVRHGDCARHLERSLELRRGLPGRAGRECAGGGERGQKGDDGPGHAPSARAITISCTSSVPSPMVRIFASR